MHMRNWIRLIAAAGVLAIPASATLAQDKKGDPNERVRIAAARAQSSNNLKQIAIAFHNTADATGVMPRDITDRAGKPLLSWRVAILPYLEQDQLYKQFKLNEPWDSDNNKKLLDKMPKTYAPPLGKFEKGETLYQSFSGAGALMGGRPVKLQNIPDGTSNTFMVIEAGGAVPWTKPADVAFDAKKPLPKLGGIFDGAFNVAMCDGSVRFVEKGVNTELLKKYITIAGGEVGTDGDFKPEK
jgi:prepilin-type processing-associated H-X9-DG protein